VPRRRDSLPERQSGRSIAYGLAAVAGLLAVFLDIPIATIRGDGGLWAGALGPDLAQNLTGHLIFQRPGWHWPVLVSPDLFWPRGESIAMTDSNPLLSLIAKLLAGFTGDPVNLFGWWFAACWLLQPIAAVYAVRGFGATRWPAAIAAAIVALSFPAWLVRVGHVNLCGQFLVLAALGVSARMIRRQAGAASRDWAAAYGVLLVAILVHPYLFIIAAAVLAAPALQALIERRQRRWHIALLFALAVIAAFLPFKVLSGETGGADSGFGLYSMNLLSPVWPQLSGIFGRDLKMIDATGGQNEGFNYLGAGGLLLIAAAGLLAWRSPGWRQWRGLGAILVILTLLALSTQVYAGGTLILPLGVHPWDAVFGIVRSSGRLFWPVGYALILGSIAILGAKLSRRALYPLLLVATIAQWIDAGPLRGNAEAYLAGAAPSGASPTLPSGVTLLTTLPVCARDDWAVTTAATLRLQAVREGARLSDIKLSRLPRWFNCERALTDGLELPLAPGELRVLLEPDATDRLRQEALGAGAQCRRQGAAVLCADGLSLRDGAPVTPAPPLPIMPAATRLEDAALAPFLAFGWRREADAPVFWSEGPRATLLARLPATSEPGGFTLRLALAGIARTEGGKRDITITIGTAAPVDIDLADGRRTEIALPVPMEMAETGILRVAFDIFRPVDPARRRIAAPVNRAGLRLYTVDLERTGGD
jgi:hypothetical protein